MALQTAFIQRLPSLRQTRARGSHHPIRTINDQNSNLINVTHGVATFSSGTLRTLKNEQHGLIACGRLTKSGERLKLRRVVEGIERIHVRELDDENAIRLPMATLRHFVG